MKKKRTSSDISESEDDNLPIAEFSRTRVRRSSSSNKINYKEPDSDSEITDSEGETTRKKQKKVTKANKKAPKKTAPKKRKLSLKKLPKTKKPKITKQKKKPKPKVLTATKKLDLAMQAYKWWEHETANKSMPEDWKWEKLEHNGIMFPPHFEPKLDKLNINLFYDGEVVKLNQEAEELAWLYALVPVESQQLAIPEVAKVFNKNFFRDFRSILNPDLKKKIKSFSGLDFSEIRDWLKKEKEERLEKTKEEKLRIKEENEQLKVKYSFGFVDGFIQRVGNVMVEPPGLFRGRGVHPKTGTFKHRVYPEQVTVNIGEDEIVPPCPLDGHSWGTIVHKHDVTWLAYWKENVLGNYKYVWLAGSSGFKGKADRDKYEKARRLKNCIGKIREDYERNLKSKDLRSAQIATAMWVIDRLALRVGHEKDDDEADTVGCCSLRVEHIKLKEGKILVLDFLGKDSMRHFQEYNLVEKYGDVGKKVFENFESFCKGRKPHEDVFHLAEPTRLNDHLKSLMPGLSAKVFRTYNASSTLEECLPHKIKSGVSVHKKMLLYNAANREVALLCNHQRTVSKATEKSLANLDDSITHLKRQLKELKSYLSKRKKGENIILKDEEKFVKMENSLNKKFNTEKKKATKEYKEALRAFQIEKRKANHMFTRQPSVANLQTRIGNWKKKLDNQILVKKNKDDNKTVALTTSKVNYMDPRISVAWAKRNDVPIEKIFTAVLRDKFPWAMSESTEYKF
eukprot:snap_masked-scaffold_1-processed-gene-16.43-mRNA-1 protein AED:0.00 eAED:0.00 QI:0/-1/0/1/-1/1/1/0/737